MKKRARITYLSDDGKTIDLPVAIGSILYWVQTDCENQCSQAKFIRNAEYVTFECSHNAICHTVARNSIRIRMTLDNLDLVLREWGDTIFETKDEAIKRYN